MKSTGRVKLIVGLGNPGREYQRTRHNVGFMVVEALSRRHHIPVKARRNKASVGQGRVADAEVVLAKPLTFMNVSGEAVGGLVRRYRLAPADILVLCDDANLPLGRVRIRPKGSSGGHKGLRSIIGHLGSEEFARIRIGIGSPDRNRVDYVLSGFKRSESPIIRDAVRRAAEAVEVVLSEGIDEAMNRFNAPS